MPFGNSDAGTNALRAPLQPVHLLQQPALAMQTAGMASAEQTGARSFVKGSAQAANSENAQPLQRMNASVAASAADTNAAMTATGDGRGVLWCATRIDTGTRQPQRGMSSMGSPVAGTPKGSAVLLAGLRSPGEPLSNLWKPCTEDAGPGMVRL